VSLRALPTSLDPPRTGAAVAAAPGLAGRTVSIASLGNAVTGAMFALLSSHFAGVHRATFEADLAEKNAAILLEDADGRLRGFSTLRVYQTKVCGDPVTIVYSGDTIVERAWWGSAALPKTWIRSVRQFETAGGGDLYWLLLTSGYRTYRFLPVFFRSFYPRYDTAPGVSSTSARAMLDAIALERFGARYDAASGLVRFERPYVLAGDLLDIPTGKSEDAHVQFFLRKNPGFIVGDELVCLTRIHEDNLTAAGRRMARGA
jgi:hypothetical protein